MEQGKTTTIEKTTCFIVLPFINKRRECGFTMDNEMSYALGAFEMRAETEEYKLLTEEKNDDREYIRKLEWKREMIMLL